MNLTAQELRQISIPKIHYDKAHGEGHGKAILTEKQVREIREAYVPWKMSSYKLAKKYNVSRATIADILNGRTWRRV